jgi:predicted transport protein
VGINMSDIKLYNINRNKTIKRKSSEKSIDSIIEFYSEELLGIKKIATNLHITENPNEEVSFLGYDENYQLTVVEYQTKKDIRVISKGLIFIDYVVKNNGKIKSYLNELLGFETSKLINLIPRIVIVGTDFNQYDEYAIKKFSYSIELLKYVFFDNYLILEKNFQSTKLDIINEFNFKDQNEFNIYKEIKEYINSLGDEVCEVINKDSISYRRIKNFIIINFNEFFQIKVLISDNYKTIIIKSLKDIEKVKSLIEQSYDEN